MSGDGDKQTHAPMVETFATAALYMVETALLVFAALSLFRDIITESWWMIGLNTFQLLFSLVISGCLQLRPRGKLRDFIHRTLVASLLLLVLHSVWQGVVEKDDAENVSETSERDLFMSFIGLGILRAGVWIANTVDVIGIWWAASRRAAADRR